MEAVSRALDRLNIRGVDQRMRIRVQPGGAVRLHRRDGGGRARRGRPPGIGHAGQPVGAISGELLAHRADDRAAEADEHHARGCGFGLRRHDLDQARQDLRAALDFDVDLHPVPRQRERLRQGGDALTRELGALPGTGVQCLELRQRGSGDRQAAVRGPRRRGVMHADDLVVRRQINITLKPCCLTVHRQLKCGHRIFRRIIRLAAMRDETDVFRARHLCQADANRRCA